MNSAYAFEFGDRSGLNEHTRDLLCRHAAAFCIYELDGYPAPRQITTDFIQECLDCLFSQQGRGCSQ